MINQTFPRARTVTLTDKFKQRILVERVGARASDRARAVRLVIPTSANNFTLDFCQVNERSVKPS
jgi:hypothetical protein